MIIFINDERAYRSWITHHRQALVLEGRRPSAKQLVLHRATCPEVKGTGSNRAHSAAGRKFKACSADAEELQAWAMEEAGKRAKACGNCHPDRPNDNGATGEIHLSKLCAEILDYVLEAALIHMEHEHPPYHLTVSDIAACFAKTPAQVATPIGTLIDDGLVTMDGVRTRSKRIVWPTIRAVRTIEGFRAESDEMIEAELAKLHVA
jgi:hypothetical protein